MNIWYIKRYYIIVSVPIRDEDDIIEFVKNVLINSRTHLGEYT